MRRKRKAAILYSVLSTGLIVLLIKMDLLFETRDRKLESDTDDVPLLKTSTKRYKRALNELVNDWLDGKVGESPPAEEWDKAMVKKVNDFENKVEDDATPFKSNVKRTEYSNELEHEVEAEKKAGKTGRTANDAGIKDTGNKGKEIKHANIGNVPAENGGKNNVNDNQKEAKDILTEDHDDVYNALLDWKVQNHLKTVNAHRQWLRLTQDCLGKCGIEFSGKITQLVRKHDMSKYTHREALGYAVMFGDYQVDWKQLTDETEKDAWQESLEHHYAVNPHHPEYFFPKLTDGKRDKSKGMLESDKENGEDYLIESLIDMLAARGERVLKNDQEFSLSKWLDIDGRYMARYNDEDRLFVCELLEKWKAAVDTLDDSDMGRFHGHFDGRPVVKDIPL